MFLTLGINIVRPMTIPCNLGKPYIRKLCKCTITINRIIICITFMVSYSEIMKVWGFLPKTITQKPASHFLYNSLAVLVRHRQAQKCLQINPKPFKQVSMEF